MNLNTDQSFKYSGQVCIKAISNNICYKTINVKNSGTNYLFKIFRDALTGNQKNKDRVSTLRLYSSGSTTSALTEVTFENFTLSDSDADNSVTFKFYVPFYKIPASTDINKLALFSEGTIQSRQELASITLSDSNKITANGNTDFIIYWKLSVDNQ